MFPTLIIAGASLVLAVYLGALIVPRVRRSPPSSNGGQWSCATLCRAICKTDR